MFTISLDTDTRGILYVLEIGMDDRKVIKIGITNRKIEDRICEIVTSFFKSYRYFPMVYPKRFRKIDDNYSKEQELLRYFSEYKYISEKKFGGCTELVELELELVVKSYEILEKGGVLPESEEECSVCGKKMKFELNGKACCGHGHTN